MLLYESPNSPRFKSGGREPGSYKKQCRTSSLCSAAFDRASFVGYL